jgi:polar amino acid transport system substrate-binding protein
MRIIMKSKALTATALIVVGLFGVTACSSGTPDPVPASAAITSGIDEAAAAAVPQAIRDAGVLRVAAGIPYPPFLLIDENEELSGLDFELATALGEKLDLTFDMQQQAFASVIPSLQADRFDIIMMGMNDSVERQQTLNFVDYINAGFTIVVQKGNPENIGTLLDLCGQTVAVQLSTIQGEILRDLVPKCAAQGREGVEVQELPAANDAQTALKSGRVQAYVVDAPVAAFTVETSGGGEDFEGVQDPVNPQGFNPVYTGFGLLKENADMTEALRLALQALIDEGVYGDIMAAYGMAPLSVTEAIINRAGE